MTWAGASPVAEAVQSFLLAETWEASRAIVSAEPDALLGEEPQQLLRVLVEEAEQAGEERMAALVEDHRRLLERCRAVGIDAAFEQLAAPEAPVDIDAVVAELAQPAAGTADIARRLELCRAALAFVSRDEKPELWALLQAALGTALMLAPIGDRAQGLDDAIAAFEAALEGLAGDEASVTRARTLNNLGLALEARLRGEADQNLERAIKAYQAAVEAFGFEGTEEERAESLSNLANVYNRRQHGRRDENRDHAIALYKKALKLIPDDQSSFDRAKIQVNLGIALMERASGSPLQNLDGAIEQFDAALRTLDATIGPSDWAHAQANLGTALQLRAAATGDDEDHERAIVAHEAALEAYTDLRAPLERALALGNLGNTLLARSGGDRRANVERAISCLDEAVEGLSQTSSPLEWGRAQNNRGNAFRARIAGERATNLEKAIAAYEAALQVLDARNAPAEYAQAKKNLGTSYRGRLEGAREDNLARAMDAYRDALEVRERIYGPEHPRVASVLYSMAKAQRLAGDLAGARESLASALSIDEANPFGDREHLGRGYRSLAETARQLGELEVAEAALLRALEIDEDLRGPDHPDVFVDLRELSRVRRELGQDEGAAEALERAMTIEQLSPGGAAAGVRRALEELAELTRNAGDFSLTRRMLELGVALDEEQYGRDHRRVEESQTKLDELLNEVRGVIGAPETLERAAKIVRRSRGRVPPRIAAAGATLSRLRDSSKRPPSLSFEEELKGHIGFGALEPAEGNERGRQDATGLELRMRIEIDDVFRFLGNAAQAGTVSGVVRCDRLGGERPILDGAYNIVFERRRGPRRRVTYELRFENGEGVAHLLNGQKEIDEDADEDLLATMFNLPTYLVQDGGDGDVLAAGIVSVRHLDFLKQLSTFRVEAATEEVRLAALERFGRVALGPLWGANAHHVFAAAASSEAPTSLQTSLS